MKTCRECGKEKEDTCFRPQTRKCKVCNDAATKARVAQLPPEEKKAWYEKRNAAMRARYADPTERQKIRERVSARRAKGTEWFARNVEKLHALGAAFRQKNREKIRARQRANYIKERQKTKTTRARVWQLRNKDKVNAGARKMRADCRLWYVRTQLAQRMGVPTSQVPQDLVEVKQLQLKLKRYYDEHTKNTA